MQIGARMEHIPASRRTVTMAIAVIAVITLSIAMLCGCGTARNTNQATDSGSGGKRLASSLQAYATQLLGQDSGMDPAQKATLRKAATSGKISRPITRPHGADTSRASKTRAIRGRH